MAIPKRNAITITPAAVKRIKELIEIRKEPTAGIRIGVSTKGCSGLSYTLEYANEQNRYDEEVIVDDIKVLIDPKAILFIIGTEMDYMEETMKSGFIFNNPNKKGECGCGSSFHV